MIKFTSAALPAIAAAALCTAGLFGAPTAFAETVEVRYADLDLNTVDGQKKLESRIHRAANAVCSAKRPTTGSNIRIVDQECYRQAMGNVRDHVAAAIDKAGDDSRLGG